MKVLVIGGTGLISGPLVSALQERGAQVTIFHRHPLPLDQLGETREIIGDRANRGKFKDQVRATGPWDCVIDMIGGSRDDAEGLIEGVGELTPQVIFCSTTTVYGRPFESLPVNENALCLPPSPYGENKLAAEQLLWEAVERDRFCLTVFRPAHIYNQRSLPLNALGNRTSHLDRIRRGRPVVVQDDGEVRWSSLSADDCAVGIAAAVGNKRAFGNTYNLAGSDRFSWNTYQEILAASLGGASPELIHVPAEILARLAPERSAQCRRTLRFGGDYDCGSAQRDLCFYPKVSVYEGLQQNIRFLHDHGLIESWEGDPDYEEVIERVIKN